MVPRELWRKNQLNTVTLREQAEGQLNMETILKILPLKCWRTIIPLREKTPCVEDGKTERKDQLRTSYWVSSNPVGHSRTMGSWTHNGVGKCSGLECRARNHLHGDYRVSHVNK